MADFDSEQKTDADRARQGARILRKAAGRALKGQIKKTAIKVGLRAIIVWAMPILGPFLAVLAVAMVVILVLTSMCGNWKGRLVSAGAGLLAGADYCKVFEPFRGMANYIDTGNIPTISK